MSYEVRLAKKVVKRLARLPGSARRRMGEALAGLEENPRPANAGKLQAREGYKLRVGDYRALYRIDDAQRRIFVTRVGHRRDVYR